MALYHNFVACFSVEVAVVFFAVFNEAVAMSLSDFNKFFPFHYYCLFSFTLQSYDIFVIYANFSATFFKIIYFVTRTTEQPGRSRPAPNGREP